jgi:hypothetical protein
MAETAARAQQLPQRTHIYQNHALDSLRWDSVALRDDDIVVATSYKAGTTWMQGIVANLIFSGQELPAPLFEMSPWVDVRIIPIESVVTQLEQQAHRRFIKTHLPLDGLRYDRRLKYVYVGRDARDVFMSFWNHYGSYTEEAYARFNGTPGRVGPEIPRCPDDIHEVWRNWITRGWFGPRAIRSGPTCIMCSRGGTTVSCPIFSSCITPTCWPTSKVRPGVSPNSWTSRFPMPPGRRSSATAPSPK